MEPDFFGAARRLGASLLINKTSSTNEQNRLLLGPPSVAKFARANNARPCVRRSLIASRAGLGTDLISGPRTARLARRAKKAPRKAHVPGGQRTSSPFRERLDAITLACGRTRCRSL